MTLRAVDPYSKMRSEINLLRASVAALEQSISVAYVEEYDPAVIQKVDEQFNYFNGFSCTEASAISPSPYFLRDTLLVAPDTSVMTVENGLYKETIDASEMNNDYWRLRGARTGLISSSSSVNEVISFETLISFSVGMLGGTVNPRTLCYVGFTSFDEALSATTPGVKFGVVFEIYREAVAAGFWPELQGPFTNAQIRAKVIDNDPITPIVVHNELLTDETYFSTDEILANYVKLKIEIRPTMVKFFVNDVEVSSFSTLLFSQQTPGGATALVPTIWGRASNVGAGLTGNVNMYVDYIRTITPVIKFTTTPGPF